MSKPFKTIKEQILILKSRNLEIENEEIAESILSQINYYNIINGYKKVFLKRDLKGVLLDPEEFKTGSNFDELYQLYQMDIELKNCIFRFLLRFEKLLKTSCAYHFSEKHREEYAYLQMKNYSLDTKDLTNVLRNLSTLSNLVSSNNKKTGKPSIKHYIDKHGEIPLWVLINFLTLGNLSYFYSSLDNSLQSKIAKDFSKRYKKEYSSKEKIDVGEIKEALKVTNYFRNIVAHDEVLYSFNINKASSTTNFSKYFKGNYRGQGLNDLIMILKLVLPKVEHEMLIKEVKDIFARYNSKFNTVKFDDIIRVAGFHSLWYEI